MPPPPSNFGPNLTWRLLSSTPSFKNATLDAEKTVQNRTYCLYQMQWKIYLWKLCSCLFQMLILRPAWLPPFKFIFTGILLLDKKSQGSSKHLVYEGGTNRKRAGAFNATAKNRVKALWNHYRQCLF